MSDDAHRALADRLAAVKDAPREELTRLADHPTH